MARDAAVMFRPGDLAPALDARVSGVDGSRTRNEVAQRDLDRYYRLLEVEGSDLDFAPDEWLLLRDVIGAGHVGVWRSAVSIGMAVGDAIRLDGRDVADAGALLHRLFAMTPGQAMALCDIVERWWIAQERHPGGTRTDD